MQKIVTLNVLHVNPFILYDHDYIPKRENLFIDLQ